MWSGKLGYITETNHRVKLKHGSSAAHQMPYKQGTEIRAVTQYHVEKQLKAGLIEAATSEWESPVIFPLEKCGKIRFCLDYRNLRMANVEDTRFLGYRI